MGTRFPYSNEVRFKLSGQGKVNLKMRLPEWQSGYKVEVNGTVIQCKVADGWIIIEDVFAGSEIKLTFDFALRFKEKRAKRVTIAAVNYGPITLAAEKGEKIAPPNIDLTIPVEEQLEKIEGLTFRLKDSDVVFKPFMDYVENEEYYMYFRSVEKKKYTV